jgi:hypothetical protein
VDQPGIGNCGRIEAHTPSHLTRRIVVERCERLVQLRSRPFSVLGAQGVIAVPHYDHRGRHNRFLLHVPLSAVIAGFDFCHGRRRTPCPSHCR